MRSLTTLALALLVAVAQAAADAPQIRLAQSDVDAMQAHDAGPGTSGVGGILTTVVAGDPSKPGSYIIRLSIPAHTRIQAHTHRDDRSVVVVAGTWYFGYGTTAEAAGEKALPPGSFYTEPGGVPHFAETRETPVIVYITGSGPSDTVYVRQSGNSAAR